MAALIHIRMLHAVYMYTRKKPEPLISKAYWGSGTGEDTALMINVTDWRLINEAHKRMS